MLTDYRLFNGLQRGVDGGTIFANDIGDYRLYSYSFECHMGKAWNEFNRQARGLIVHVPTKSVVCRPLSKFFNLNEMDESKLENLPVNQEFFLQEKLDGSCVSTYIRDGALACATPGSMISEQSRWAEKWLSHHLKYSGQEFDDTKFKEFKKLNEDLTFIFEAIYPENLNVVAYGDRNELVLLSIKDHSGLEWHPSRVDQIAVKFGFSRPKVYNYALDADLINKVPRDEEGYVAFWPDLGLRVKIKGETYVQLHKVKSMFSEKGVCEILAEGRYSELYAILPKHLSKQCDDIASLLRTKFFALKHEAEDTYEKIKDLPTRKEQALTIQKCASQKVWGTVFTMLDSCKKQIPQDVIDRMIWRVIFDSLGHKK